MKAPLQPIETTGRFQLVCYDLAGPFSPVTARGNTYVLIVVDHFSHWPEFIPLRDTSAPTLARALFDQWCCRYGTPERFHSDGANNVHGYVMKEISNLLGIDKTKSSRLHPQGDGLAESFVKVMKSCIQKHVDSHGSNWDLYIQAAAYAVRSNTAYNTKVSPAELVFGEKINMALNPSAVTHSACATYNQKQAIEFVKQLHTKIESTTTTTNSCLNKSRDKMKQSYDKSSKAHNFSTDNKVMLWNPYFKRGISKSLQPRWTGPWTIVRFTSNTNCLIRRGDVEKYVHVNQLKHAVVRKQELLPTKPPIVIHTEKSKPPLTTEMSHFPFDDDHNDENDLEDNLPRRNQDIPRVTINRAWVEVDPANVLPHRTRGGVG